jgi:glycosyltransferase involved in cell wall biosynthesis
VIFFIFSYNRGPHLMNCVESIERCSPGSKIIVYDDASDDLETMAVLRNISCRHEVRSSRDESRESHGSLYANMQSALDSVVGDRVICFVQDDVQLVREISEEDHGFICDYFSRNPSAGFLSSVFQRGITRRKTLDRFVYDSDRRVHFCMHESRKAVAGRYYSDISITTSGRLKSVGWQFARSEFENELQAKNCFDAMGYMHSPFVMWLPNPPAYRNKKKTLAFRIAEKMNKAGLYPFEYMAAPEVERLRGRPGAGVPIAEEFLTVSVPGLKAPWIYHPLKRSRILRKLDKLENFARSFLRK